MAKNRAYLDEVMIRLELDNGGYESLLSESECEEETTESFSYQLELDRMEALNASIVLGINIPGLEEQEEEAEQSVIFVYIPSRYFTSFLFRNLCWRRSMPMRSSRVQFLTRLL